MKYQTVCEKCGKIIIDSKNISVRDCNVCDECGMTVCDDCDSCRCSEVKK